MNVQKVVKPPQIHKVLESKKDQNIVIAACGRWLRLDTTKETTQEVTCKYCMIYLEGALTTKDESTQQGG